MKRMDERAQEEQPHSRVNRISPLLVSWGIVDGLRLSVRMRFSLFPPNRGKAGVADRRQRCVTRVARPERSTVSENCEEPKA